MTPSSTLTLSSIFFDGPWSWGGAGENRIQFNIDGTGSLYCGAGFTRLIAANFSWTTPDREELEKSIDINLQRESSTTVVVAELQMQITLTTARPPNHDHLLLNEYYVRETAFGSKVFAIRIEKGAFLEQQHKRLAKSIPPLGRYNWRLVFDKSPMPPDADWKEEALICIEYARLWDCTEFVNHLILRRLGARSQYVHAQSRPCLFL